MERRTDKLQEGRRESNRRCWYAGETSSMKWKETSMQNLAPIALPLFFSSNNNRERLFVTSRPSYLQMRASSQKCIMQPLILPVQQRTMAAPAFLRARKRIIFSCFLHFRGTFLPLCWRVCRHLFPVFPSPKAKLTHLCSCRAGTDAQTQPSRFTPSRSHTHKHILFFQAIERVSCPPPPPLHPYPLAVTPERPRTPHSPIWMLLGKLAPNTAPRKLVQKKAKMCCIFPFALEKKKPSSKHRFDFSPALLSLAASLASPPLRLQGCASPSLGIQRWDCCSAPPGSGINWAPGEGKRARSSSTSLPRHTHHTHAHTPRRFHPARSSSPSWSSAAGTASLLPPPLAPAVPTLLGVLAGVSKDSSHLPLNSRLCPSTSFGRS